MLNELIYFLYFRHIYLLIFFFYFIKYNTDLALHSCNTIHQSQNKKSSSFLCHAVFSLLPKTGAYVTHNAQLDLSQFIHRFGCVMLKNDVTRGDLLDFTQLHLETKGFIQLISHTVYSTHKTCKQTSMSKISGVLL